MIKKIIKGIKNPKLVFLFLLNYKIFRLIPDALYLKIEYRLRVGKKLNLDVPKTFNEKIQWLKLYDRKPEYTNLVDKYEVRRHIANTIGEKHLIPLYGVYNTFDEINFESLPSQFVLKPTHTSGNIYICKDKSKIDFISLRKEINAWLKREYYWPNREWPYKNIKPRIICEKYMVDESNIELKDYKFQCFYGKPELIQVDFGRFTNHHRNLFDANWNYIDASILYPNDPNTIIERPICLEKMLELASILAKSIPHVRVDFYLVKTEIYFGELTFYHGSGYEPFTPSELELQMGNWLKLPMRIDK